MARSYEPEKRINGRISKVKREVEGKRMKKPLYCRRMLDVNCLFKARQGATFIGR